jgi:hypothetical protein
MEPIYKEHRFEAAKIRYENQTDLLKRLTELDLRIFTGYITIQLLLGSWFSVHPLTSLIAKIGLMLIDIVLAVIAGALLYNTSRRRLEVVETLKNLSEAFGFSTEGVYIKTKPLCTESA